MKRILALLLALTLMFALAACGNGDSAGGDTAPDEAGENPPTDPGDNAEPPADGGSDTDSYELALITDIGTIDDKSFNQGSWEGLVAYAQENGISHKYYQPLEQSTDAYLSAIELAIRGGAKLVVTPGYLFEEAIYQAQDSFPEVSFILIDGSPHDAAYNYNTAANTVGVTYAEHEAGFLAGYAAVMDGNRSLGFLGGMAVPAVVRFGYGYVQGAEHAARELNLNAGDVTINYHYTGGFDATPEAQAMAASWYQSGIEVIFGCGGAVGNSVMAAADAAGGKVIGVDVDQSGESDTVITSSMKGLAPSVYDLVSQYYAGTFPGGQDLVFDAANDGVMLPMETSKFESFSQSDYDAIYAELVAGNIEMVTDADVEDVSGIETAAVTVTKVG